MPRSSTTRGLVAALTAAIAGLSLSAPSVAEAKPSKPQRTHLTSVQLLSFNDYHGHLEATDGPLSRAQDPSQTPAGGAEYLATRLAALRAQAPGGHSLTVAAGDLIGGSPFLSGMFHDEPSVESLNAMKLDVSSVGNHEFDEGTQELLRMQRGGCHPADGCYFPDSPYAGAKFKWLAANVVKKNGTGTLLPGTWVKRVGGVRIGFIGMTLEATPTLVSPAGVSKVRFLDEVKTANRKARQLNRRGVKAIVVLLHEGGYQTGTFQGCEGISEPIAQIAAQMSPRIDQIISGHTHQGYVCKLPDPKGNPRLVTSATNYGQAITETNLVINRHTGDVNRTLTTAHNILNARDVDKDPAITSIISKWKAISDARGAVVVGTNAEDILGDASGNRGIETPMVDLIADAILAATDGPSEGAAQIAFMNVGGVRSSFKFAPKYTEGAGQITYKEVYDVMPFGNRLVTISMTGDQIRQALEQQYQPVPARGSRPMLALGVSNGFSYTWDASQPQGSRVVAGSMMLNGQPIDMGATYRVGTLSFLQEGGDLFEAFKLGTNLVGGPEDIPAVVSYLGANPNITAPASRIDGL
ncbi:MAG TPA: bifunctional metallophosphatase/5'-nucleotidase [Marmoricola sp.]|nr:bifunctional metallophosphatase/5'-nucleotidase [Marmoricola sp.]